MGTKHGLLCHMCVMKKDYTQYRASQFVVDPFFLQWRITRNKKSSRYWETFIREHPEKQKEIEEAIRIVSVIRVNDYSFSKTEKEQIFARVLNTGKRYRFKKRLRVVTAVAAGVTLLCSLTLFLSWERSDELQMVQNQDSFAFRQENIQLITAGQETFELENNINVVYRSEGCVQIRGGQQQQEILSKNTLVHSGKNTLIVPFGKSTSLTLSDDTRIWLNAGSRVEFPTCFTDGKREIYAEGEIYLEVAKDSVLPFIVRTPFYNVRVLGTKFSISAYKDESRHTVVLAEGAVEVELQDNDVYQLTPNHKLTIVGQETELTKVQPYEYISWKDGILQFSQETLSTILKRIARYYGVEIDYRPEDEELFNGKLVLFEDIRTVLDNLAVIYSISYTIDGRRIQISNNL